MSCFRIGNKTNSSLLVIYHLSLMYCLNIYLCWVGELKIY